MCVHLFCLVFSQDCIIHFCTPFVEWQIYGNLYTNADCFVFVKEINGEKKVMHFLVGCLRRAVGCMHWEPLWLIQRGLRSPFVGFQWLLKDYCLLAIPGGAETSHPTWMNRTLFWGLWVPHPWLRAFSIGSILTSRHSTGKNPYSYSRSLSLEDSDLNKLVGWFVDILTVWCMLWIFSENTHILANMQNFCLRGNFGDVNVCFLPVFFLLFFST